MDNYRLSSDFNAEFDNRLSKEIKIEQSTHCSMKDILELQRIFIENKKQWVINAEKFLASVASYDICKEKEIIQSFVHNINSGLKNYTENDPTIFIRMVNNRDFCVVLCRMEDYMFTANAILMHIRIILHSIYADYQLSWNAWIIPSKFRSPEKIKMLQNYAVELLSKLKTIQINVCL